MKKGRAAVFVGPNKPMEIREYSVPDPEPGAILIKVKLCNICGSDAHAWQGNFQTTKMGGSLPTILGHEMVGVVERLGEGVQFDSNGEPLHEGDRVIYQYFYHCGKCVDCLKGNTTACNNLSMAMLGNSEEYPYFVGGFAEYYYLQPNHVVYKVPDKVPDEIVSGANCALAQVISGLNRANFRFNETVVIQGAGGLGLYASAVAKFMGAKKVIVIDGLEDRLDLVKRFGADEIINIREYKEARSRVNRVKELTEGRGADVVVELVGHPSVINEGLNMLSFFGRYLEIGNISKGKTVEIDPTNIVFGNKSIIGVSLYEPTALKTALDFLERTINIYPYEELYSSKFNLNDINKAIEKSINREVKRASIVMD